MENSSSIKSALIKYGIAVIVASAMVLLILWGRDYWSQTELVEQYRFLSDAFTIPGSVFILSGALVALANEGALDAVGYMVKRCIQMLNPFSKKEFQKYSDYVAGKKKIRGYSFLFFVGLFYLAIGIVFVILFYSVYSA